MGFGIKRRPAEERIGRRRGESRQPGEQSTGAGRSPVSIQSPVYGRRAEAHGVLCIRRRPAAERIGRRRGERRRPGSGARTRWPISGLWQRRAQPGAGRHRDALAFFARMSTDPSVPPLTDPSFAYAFPLALKSCAVLRHHTAAASLHALAHKCGGLLQSPFVASALVASYGACASPEAARSLFDELPCHNAVVWSAMISVYVRSGDVTAAARALGDMDVAPAASCFYSVIAAVAESGEHPDRAVELYRRMQGMGVKSSLITLLALAPACAAMGALSSVREVHGFAVRHGMSTSCHLGSSLIEAYGWCGSLVGAQRVFDQVEERDVVVWSSNVSAYAFHGQGDVAMSLFRRMELDNVRPDGIMFLGVLKACGHAGRADDALKYFDVLTKTYGVEACGDHYSCLVDVLGRAGRLQQDYDVIRIMPVRVTAKAWGALLAACRKYGDVGLAEIAARALFEIEPETQLKLRECRELCFACKCLFRLGYA